MKAKIDPGLRPIFRKIGVPKPEPFRPDPFQLEALRLIKDCDVVVSAATGSGKTWIASQAIHSYLADGLSVWYASPLKALSNAIYQEFCHEFGPSNCGILTGDRKENPGAPVIVGTTEILRNQLYDAMHQGMSVRADLVILDEAHYLNDPDRGVVWEEVLIYLPARVRLLLLSATISNAEELCEWLSEIRSTANRVVRSDVRPVPLEMLFLLDEAVIVPLMGKKGLSPKVKKFVTSKGGVQRVRRDKVSFGQLIKNLRALDLLPAIFFLKSRSDCDRAVFTCPPVHIDSEKKAVFRNAVDMFLRDYAHLQGHRQIRPLLESRVASHHGGQLPYWKVLIEKLMNRGYLEAIFSTSTVAAGVNFPARTVVLVQSDRYNGREFIDLTATELHQMIGRAGRRGKDRIGFGLIIPGRHQDPQLIAELMKSPPEPILSQIHINFSMTLNLLLSHTPSEVKDLLELSFAAFQHRGKEDTLRRRWDQFVSELRKILPRSKCDTTDPYEVLENIQKRAELCEEIKKLSYRIPNQSLEDALAVYLTPGRLFVHKNKRLYVVFRVFREHGRLICAAHAIRSIRLARKRRMRPRRVELSQIGAICDYCVDIPEDYSSGRLVRLFDSVPLEQVKTLPIEIQNQEFRSEELEEIQRKIDALPCETCEHFETCHKRKRAPLPKLLKDFRSLVAQMEGREGGLWPSLKRHMRFLQETGFVDQTNRLTFDGYWASKLRLDQPLLIAEAIRTGALNGVSAEILAGGLATFVWDKPLEIALAVNGVFNLAELEKSFNRILDHIEGIRARKIRRGFESPAIMFWPCVALSLWARNVPWDRLLTFVPIDEGDMASLITRTADHLRQVTNLAETHPQLAALAEDAIKLIQREPVYIP